jgi:excisionase family DNA binding protein
MGLILEGLEDHEGYAARRLPDGTLTSTGTQDTAAFVACTDTDQHATTEAGRTAAEHQWEHAHARPLLAATVPARVTELVDNLREETGELADHRPPRRPGRRPAAHRLVRAHLANEQPPRSYTTDATRWVTSNPTEASRCSGGWERTMLIDNHQPNASDTERRSQQMPTKRDQRLTISVEEAGRLLGISRGLTYELVNRGELPSVRLGRRIVVPRRALDRLLDLPDDAA